MTIIQDLEKLLHEHQELPAAVNGMLLAKDLRELVENAKASRAGEIVDFELFVNDVLEAACSGIEKDALREISYFYAKYVNDGPITIYRVTREKVDLIRYKHDQALQDLVDQAQELKLGY